MVCSASHQRSSQTELQLYLICLVHASLRESLQALQNDLFKYPHRVLTPVSGFIELVSISVISLAPRPGNKAKR